MNNFAWPDYEHVLEYLDLDVFPRDVSFEEALEIIEMCDES